MSFTHDPAGRPFEGHVALVTGPARPRRACRATALVLARGGADVACLDIARRYADAPHHGKASWDDLEALAAIVWLLSDAARGVTGEALNVSARQTMV